MIFVPSESTVPPGRYRRSPEHDTDDPVRIRALRLAVG
jgi:hypothetical protein